MGCAVKVVQGNIVDVEVDAIVNAANSSLLGGGGVDGAIHAAAGPGLYEECRLLGGCATGEAKITAGHRLKAGHIIHTVGPIWRNGRRGEDEKLRRCYQNCLRLATEHGIRTIAFPAISAGAYGFPIARAAPIAAEEIHRFLESDQSLTEIQLVCFAPGTTAVVAKAVTEIFGAEPSAGAS